MITIIGLPLGIWLINRIPTVITLRPRTREVQRMIDAAGFVNFVQVPVAQVSWVVRGVWFIFVGWWASAIVMFDRLAADRADHHAPDRPDDLQPRPLRRLAVPVLSGGGGT